MVHRAGLEPACLSAPVPETGLSTDSNICAYLRESFLSALFLLSEQTLHQIVIRVTGTNGRLAVVLYDLVDLQPEHICLLQK